MRKNIVAIEHDGLHERTLTITLDVFRTGVDVLDACRKASGEYIRTKEGFSDYITNCCNFNWADFYNQVPNSICEKYGFRKVDETYSDIEVNWDEQIANIDFVSYRISDICWAENDADLPDHCEIPFYVLMDYFEELSDVNAEDIQSRIPDYLRACYGGHPLKYRVDESLEIQVY